MTALREARQAVAGLRMSPSLILLANLVVGALGLLTVPVLTHGIGATGRGITAAAGAAVAVVPIVLAFGMPLALRRRALTTESHNVVRSYRDLALLTVFPSALVSSLLVSTVFKDVEQTQRLLVAIAT